jgi:hypothetical protein
MALPPVAPENGPVELDAATFGRAFILFTGTRMAAAAELTFCVTKSANDGAPEAVFAGATRDWTAAGLAWTFSIMAAACMQFRRNS